MQLTEFVRDDTAVSEVIGVILMVAITVLLAATAATFFLGIGQETQEPTPQVAIEFDYDKRTVSGHSEDVLKITHDGGDTVAADQVDVSVQDVATDVGVLNPRATWNDYDPTATYTEVVAGTSINVSAQSLDDVTSKDPTAVSLDASTVRVVWSSPDSSQSFTLSTWRGKNAG